MLQTNAALKRIQLFCCFVDTTLKTAQQMINKREAISVVPSTYFVSFYLVFTIASDPWAPSEVGNRMSLTSTFTIFKFSVVILQKNTC